MLKWEEKWMKKHYLGSLMMIPFLLSSCGVQAITEEEAFLYMWNIRQKQEEEDFLFPMQVTVEHRREDIANDKYEITNIVVDEEEKYCYSSKKTTNTLDLSSTYHEKWVYVKEEQCIVAINENGKLSYQTYTGDLNTLWVTYSNEIQNEAQEMMKGNTYLVSSYYQNDPKIFEDKTLQYDDKPVARYSTKGAGNLKISLSRFVIEKVSENVSQNIGKVTYEINYVDYLLQECIIKGKYTKVDAIESIEEKTKVIKKAALDYPMFSESH